MSSHPTCRARTHRKCEVSPLRDCCAVPCGVRVWETPELTSAADVPVGSRLSMSSSPGLTTRGADRMLCLANSYRVGVGGQTGTRTAEGRQDKQHVLGPLCKHKSVSLMNMERVHAWQTGWNRRRALYALSEQSQISNLQKAAKLLFSPLHCNRTESHTLRASPTHWLCSRDATSSCCSLARERMGVSLSRVLSSSILLLLLCWHDANVEARLQEGGSLLLARR